jgi:hypothetical protein
MGAYTRRSFGKMLVAASVAGPSIVALSGCSRETVIGYINAVNNAVSGILTYIGDTDLATTIHNDLAALDTAIQNWTSGTITQNVISAILLVRSNLDLIPLTPLLNGLVSLALTALASILSVSGANVIAAHVAVAVKHSPSAYVAKTHKQFARAWNTEVSAVGLPSTVKVREPLL